VTRDLDEVAREFARARSDSAKLKEKLAAAQAKVSALRPEIAAAVVEATRQGRTVQDIAEKTGYTVVRVRQICRAAGVEPIEGPKDPPPRKRRAPKKAAKTRSTEGKAG
jgi:hypothetical protein